MTHCTASGTAHVVSYKIKKPFLKNCSKSILWSQISVSQGQTDIWAGNSGYSLYSSGLGEVQAVACTDHSKDKFNIVHFLCNYSIEYLQYLIPTTVYLQYLIPTCPTMFIYPSDIFQPQFLAIFVESVVLLMSAVYMSMYLVTVCIYD